MNEEKIDKSILVFILKEDAFLIHFTFDDLKLSTLPILLESKRFKKKTTITIKYHELKALKDLMINSSNKEQLNMTGFT